MVVLRPSQAAGAGDEETVAAGANFEEEEEVGDGGEATPGQDVTAGDADATAAGGVTIELTRTRVVAE
jgi:hypothetical protein